MSEVRWVSKSAAIAIHSALIAEHGGIEGVRDHGLLESALARPRNKLAYGETDIGALAVAHGYGLCRNHPFLDGNKRIALALVDVFLQLNGEELTASEEEAVLTFRELAAGGLEEPALTRWIRENSAPLPHED